MVLGRKMLEAANGDLWFLPVLGRRAVGMGVVRFGGESWHQYTAADVRKDDAPGQMVSRVYDLAEDLQGTVWVGTGRGLWSYNGQSWTVHPEAAGRKITRVLPDGDGGIWLGCATKTKSPGGLIHHRSGTWTYVTTDQGLAVDDVWEIYRSIDGVLWVGTTQGVSRFDGKGWTTLSRSDGLLRDDVRSIAEDAAGDLWFGKHRLDERRWATRYRADRHPPDTEFTFLPGTELQTGDVLFEWSGTDAWKDTPQPDLTYSWRLDDERWSAFSADAKRTFLGLAVGSHALMARAKDRDGNIDPSPAIHRFRVLPPVWLQPWFLTLISLLVAAVGFQSGRVVLRGRRLREEHQQRLHVQQQLMEEMAKELETANRMQMSLMPRDKPHIPGLDVAGRCRPATHVGGDYYQYFVQENTLSLSLADVTGHAMEAAIPAVMFSGILKTHMDLGGTLQDRFERLNRSLYSTLEARTFVCFVMRELNLATREFTLSDSGCPYPYHFRAADRTLVELPVDAYPLGVRPDTSYITAETTLSPGDRIVFCSDGIMEALDEKEEPFGYDRTQKDILDACLRDLSADATIDHLMASVDAFRGDAPQDDDLTCVVLHVQS